jgi:hypothetical protein
MYLGSKMVANSYLKKILQKKRKTWESFISLLGIL